MLPPATRIACQPGWLWKTRKWTNACTPATIDAFPWSDLMKMRLTWSRFIQLQRELRAWLWLAAFVLG
jgi:hypothetical protein